jgi:hypothetical protein
MLTDEIAAEKATAEKIAEIERERELVKQTPEYLALQRRLEELQQRSEPS